MKKITLLFAMFLMIGVCSAITLDDLVYRAESADLELQRLSLEKQEIQQELNFRLTDFWPWFHASYYRTFTDAIADDFSQERTRQKLQLQVRQNLTDLMFVLPHRRKQFEAQLERIETERQVRRNQIRAQVSLQWYAVLRLQDRIRYLQALEGDTGHFLAYQEQLYKTGQIIVTQYQKTVSRLEDARDEVSVAIDALENAKRELAAQYNLDPSELELTQTVTFHEPPTSDWFLERLRASRINTGGLRHKERAEFLRTRLSERIDLHCYLGYSLWERYNEDLSDTPEVYLNFAVPLSLFGVSEYTGNLVRISRAREELQDRLEDRDAETALLKAYPAVYETGRRIRAARRMHELNQEEHRILTQRIASGLEPLSHTIRDTLETLVAMDRSRLELHDLQWRQEMQLLNLCLLAGTALSDIPGNSGVQSEVSPVPARRGLWVWNLPELMNDELAIGRLIETCRVNQITEVYLSLKLSMTRGLAENQAVLRLVARLHREGLEVEALFGDPAWVRPDRRQALVEALEELIEQSRRMQPDEMFDAVHLDIEPHVLDSWDGSESRHLQSLLQTVQDVRSTLPAGMPLRVDIPVFYDKYDQDFHRRLCPLVSDMVLMAYQEPDIERLMDAIRYELDTAAQNDTGVIVAQSVDMFPDRNSLTSFLDRINQSCRRYSAFGGTALHDYRRLDNLR